MNIAVSGPIVDMKYRAIMEDGSIYEVPVLFIAMDRARYYAKIDDVELNESLNNDTIPLFLDDEYEIADWAKNNMDWDDVKNVAKQVKGPSNVDFQEGWVNGEYAIQGK